MVGTLRQAALPRKREKAFLAKHQFLPSPACGGGGVVVRDGGGKEAEVVRHAPSVSIRR